MAVKALSDMLIKRRKRVSRGRVLAFSKRLGTLSLQLLHHGAAACLGLLRQLISTHTVALQLLDSDHEVTFFLHYSKKNLHAVQNKG